MIEAPSVSVFSVPPTHLASPEILANDSTFRALPYSKQPGVITTSASFPP